MSKPITYTAAGFRRALDARIRVCDCGHRVLLSRQRSTVTTTCPVCDRPITTTRGN